MTKTKFSKLSEPTRVLLNKAKSKLLSKNPKLDRATDDVVISTALKSYLGAKE